MPSESRSVAPQSDSRTQVGTVALPAEPSLCFVLCRRAHREADRKGPLRNGVCHVTVTLQSAREPRLFGPGKGAGATFRLTMSRGLSRNYPQNATKQGFTRGMLENSAYPLRPPKNCAEWLLLTTLV